MVEFENYITNYYSIYKIIFYRFLCLSYFETKIINYFRCQKLFNKRYGNIELSVVDIYGLVLLYKGY